MIGLLKRTISFIILGLLGFSLGAAPRDGGTDVGNGGDPFAAEFVARAQNIAKNWKRFESLKKSGVEQEHFRAAILNTRVFSTHEKLWVKGKEVAAKNYPPCSKEVMDQSLCGLILFNRDLWSNTLVEEQKLVLVLHEYLGILGQSNERLDDLYEQSGAFASELIQILSKQKRIDVQFNCQVSQWDEKIQAQKILTSFDTYGSVHADRDFYALTLEGLPQRLQIRALLVQKEFLAENLMSSLYITLDRVPDNGLINGARSLFKGEMEFLSSGKKRLRISRNPELDLTCYRVLDEGI